MALESPRFRKVNESFACGQCGFQVQPATSTCRDHCPMCLWSRHVDENPGDRQSSCGGMLRPVGYEKHPKKGWMISYLCDHCGMSRTNRFLEADGVAPDSFDALLKLTQK